MKANLISIGQLCDDDLHVHFDKNRCYLKEDEECIITGTRTSDNFYQMNAVVDTISMTMEVHGMELLHRRLGHVNYKLLHKLASNYYPRGTMFKKENKLVCGDYKK